MCSAAAMVKVCSNLLQSKLILTKDITYTLKYAARHGNQDAVDPFSIRETGIYHQFTAPTTRSTWILLHPPENIVGLLTKVFSDPSTSDPVTQFHCHALVLEGLSLDWHDYVNYLEERLSDLVCGRESNLSQYLTW